MQLFIYMTPQELFSYFGLNLPGWLAWMVFVLLAIWSLSWKGIALWTAAKKNQIKWFIALLIINTLGILEIIYIYLFSKKQSSWGKII